MGDKRAEAQADLALALLGTVPEHPQDLSRRLDELLRRAVWRRDPAMADVDSYAVDSSDVPYASGSLASLQTADVVNALAAAWQASYAGLIREYPEAVVRLSVGNPEDAAHLSATAALAGADVAVHIDRPSGTASWSWPLRIGIMDDHPLLGEFRDTRPDLSDVVILNDRRDAGVDLLIAPEAALARELSARGIHAGIVVTDTTNLADPHLLSELFHAFGTLFVPNLTRGGWWQRTLTDLAHDAPLDVAVRHIPGAVLVAPANALWLTSVRAYAAWLLRYGPDEPHAHLPPHLEQALTRTPFDHESAGAHVIADMLRSTGTPMRVTIGFPMAPPPDVPHLGIGYGFDAEMPQSEPDAVADAVSTDSIPKERLRAEVPRVAGAPEAAQAWPRLDSPDEVDAGDSFIARIGLRREADRGVQFVSTGQLPATEDVGITVVADGFTLEDGELEFTVNLAKTAARRLTLRAIDDPKLRAERTIGVRYTVGGALRAYAMRPILVRGATPAPQGTVESVPPGPSTTQPVAVADPAAPTLELTLQQGADVAGHVWQWTIASATLPVPATPLEQLRTTLDDTARDYQLQVVREGSVSSGKQLFDRLVARGRRLSEKLPDAVINALRAAAEATAPEPPSVLLLSTEARIPWELAVIEPPLTDAPSPFLCAQVYMGRWVMGLRGRPPVPPVSAKPAVSRAVVVGDYSGLSTWNVLPEAQSETATLVGQGARQLPAEYDPVRDAVHGIPPVDVLHFATHGRFLEGQREQGLVLVDRSGKKPVEVYFTPDDVEAGELERGPVVFLNACQVGAGETILGDYAGMAAAFLRIGAAAVIAPLWEVDDALAADAARDFYAAVPTSTVGAAVTALRGRFTAEAAAQPATARYGSFLAYQYFGHPNLKLVEDTSNE